jgi:hypothetical protein
MERKKGGRWWGSSLSPYNIKSPITITLTSSLSSQKVSSRRVRVKVNPSTNFWRDSSTRYYLDIYLSGKDKTGGSWRGNEAHLVTLSASTLRISADLRTKSFISTSRTPIYFTPFPFPLHGKYKIFLLPCPTESQNASWDGACVLMAVNRSER